MSEFAKCFAIGLVISLAIGTPATYASSDSTNRPDKTLAKTDQTTSLLAPSKLNANIQGEWVPPDGDAIIRIKYCGEHPSKLCADLVQHAYGALSDKDALNPNLKLRNRALIGVKILDGLKMTSVTSWKGGELYDPRTGKSYFAKVKLLSENEAKITGCIGPGLCKGYVWKRADPNLELIPGKLADLSKTRDSQTKKPPPQATSRTSG